MCACFGRRRARAMKIFRKKRQWVSLSFLQPCILLVLILFPLSLSLSLSLSRLPNFSFHSFFLSFSLSIYMFIYPSMFPSLSFFLSISSSMPSYLSKYLFLLLPPLSIYSIKALHFWLKIKTNFTPLLFLSGTMFNCFKTFIPNKYFSFFANFPFGLSPAACKKSDSFACKNPRFALQNCLRILPKYVE